MKKKGMFRIIFVSILLVITQLGFSQGKYYSYKEKNFTIPKYEVIDIGFNNKNKIEKPFSVNFGAIVVGPNGETMEVPGFYNGDKQWIFRFSSNTIGEWKFTTHSELKALNGKNGVIKVTEGRENKHGAIQVSKINTKKFSYEDGTPYQLQAFELDWLFALDYDNAEATPKSDHMLELLANNGINQIVTTLYSYDISPERFDWTREEKLEQYFEHEFGGKDEIYPFLGSNKNPDFSALNVTFFKRFDRMMSVMDKNDIVAHLMIYVWNKNVNWPAAESEADNMYFDYIIKRYQAFSNVIWDVSKEALNNQRCTEEYGRERISRIDSLDAYDRLVTVHDFGFCDRNTDVVDFISTQDWSINIHAEMLKLYNEFDKPIFNIEHGGYEKSPYQVFPGNYDNPEYCLRRNYECYFAGAYATYYWQGAAWNVIIYNPFQQGEDFIKPKFEYYKHLKSFFSKMDYSQFVPNAGSDYGLTSNDGKTMLRYVPKENYQVTIYGTNGIGQISGTYQWFNTHTGAYTNETAYEGGSLKAPWSNKADAILIRKLN